MLAEDIRRQGHRLVRQRRSDQGLRHPVQGNAKTTQFDMTTLGFPTSLVNQPSFRSPLAEDYPPINVAGRATINPYGSTLSTEDIHAVNVGAFHSLSNHDFKFGFDSRICRDDRYTFGNATPTFTFNPIYTNGPLDNSPASPGSIGQGYASLLLGLPTSGQVDRQLSSRINSLGLVRAGQLARDSEAPGDPRLAV
jgi:hypothetical protein